MKFVKCLSLGPHVDEDRKESTRNGCRSEQDIVYEVRGTGIQAVGDRAEVPEHRTSGIEIRRADEQASSFSVFRRDFRDHVGVNIARDDAAQRRSIGGRAFTASAQ